MNLDQWWTIAAGLGIALAVSWLALILALAIVRPKGPLLREALRIRIALLLAYLAMPFDPIPDFIPVLGYADNAIIVAAVLRSVVRRAGLPAVQQHWPGTDNGFAALRALTGLTNTSPR